MQIVMTGATGFLGRPLTAKLLADGHSVTVISRDASSVVSRLGSQVRGLAWKDTEVWQRAVTEADTIINLAGESVSGGRWTPEFKAKIRESRVNTTRMLVDAMRANSRADQSFLSASAIGYYGDRQDETLTETSSPGHDFLAEVCAAWEAEANRAREGGARVVCFRLGVVLGEGGALEKMLTPLPLPISPWKLGLGGPMVSGRQWISWIHEKDVLAMFLWALRNAEVRGPVNVTAPNPSRNAEFARILGRVLHRPAILPLPGFVLKMVLGEFAQALLGSQKVMPTVAEQQGFSFAYPQLEPALRALLSK